MSRIGRTLKGTRRIALGWLTPTKRQARKFLEREAAPLLKTVIYELQRQTEIHERESRHPNYIEPAERTMPTFIRAAKRNYENRVSHEAESAMDAAGIFDPETRKRIENCTFALLEDQVELAKRGERARELMEFAQSIGWNPKAKKLAELTTKQLAQIMDTVAVFELDAELIKIPREKTGFKEMARQVMKENVSKLKVRARNAKAWLYWQRFKMLDRKFLGVMSKERHSEE